MAEPLQTPDAEQAERPPEHRGDGRAPEQHAIPDRRGGAYRYQRRNSPEAPHPGRGLSFEVHVNVSLNVGVTPTEILEAITHTAVYCGFPRALNAILAAKRVFAERDILPVTAPAA